MSKEATLKANERSCSSLDIETMQQTKEAVAADPSVGQGKFSAVTEWQAGAQAVTRARTFTIKTDEPEPLGGKDVAIDPMELSARLARVVPYHRLGHARELARRGFSKPQDHARSAYDLRGYLGLEKKWGRSVGRSD